MNPEIVEDIEFGACRLTLLGMRCQCGEIHGWVLVYESPRTPRLDVVGDVIGKTGGRFGQIEPLVCVNYDTAERAHQAFGLMLDALKPLPPTQVN